MARRTVARWFVLHLLLLAGCGGAPPTAPLPPVTPPAPAPSAPTRSVSGYVVDALDGHRVAGASIRLNTNPAGTTDADGAFAGSAPGMDWMRVDVRHPGYVNRGTYVRVADPPQTISLIPASVSLDLFDSVLRPSGTTLHRWTAPPALVVITRELQFMYLADTLIALDNVLDEAKQAALVADVRSAFLAMTDGRLGDFASVTFESPPRGTWVRIKREGAIVVSRCKGLSASGPIASNRWLTERSTIVASTIQLDPTADDVSPTPLRGHEMGHAVGFYEAHWVSLMNPTRPAVPPTVLDMQMARIAYQRPPGNQSPDEDPDPTSATGTAALVPGPLMGIRMRPAQPPHVAFFQAPRLREPLRGER